MLLILFLLVVVPIISISYYKKIKKIKLVILMNFFIFISLLISLYLYITGDYLKGEFHYSFFMLLPALIGFLIPAIHLQFELEKEYDANKINFQEFNLKNTVDILQLLSDYRVTKHLQYDTLNNKDQTIEFCKEIIEPIIIDEYSNINRIITTRGNKLVGIVLYHNINNYTCEIVFFIFFAQWNKGYGNEILKKTIDAIKSLNYYENIVINIHIDNKTMIHLATKYGFIENKINDNYQLYELQIK